MKSPPKILSHNILRIKEHECAYHSAGGAGGVVHGMAQLHYSTIAKHAKQGKATHLQTLALHSG